jgi:indolepyruvate decarboxylase
VCICGSVPLVAKEHTRLMHHTLVNGSRGEFLRAYAQVTAAQTVLSPQNAVAEIDRLIQTAWQRKLPVYMELPSDISYLEVDAPVAPLVLTTPTSDRERLASSSRAIAQRLQNATAPAIVVDLDTDRHGVAAEIVELATKLQIPIAAVSTAKAVIDETNPYYVGIYAGAGPSVRARNSPEQ